jgi:hypothetical protein
MAFAHNSNAPYLCAASSTGSVHVFRLVDDDDIDAYVCVAVSYLTRAVCHRGARRGSAGSLACTRVMCVHVCAIDHLRVASCAADWQ